MTNSTYKGSCLCGAVEIAVTGKPEVMGYCHCNSCRTWGAAPISAFTLWQPDSVQVTKGEENIGSFQFTDRSQRKFCRKCSGRLMTAHPQMKLTEVYASVLPEFAFHPGLHVFYGEKVLSMHDGLPKFDDVPKEAGGSGKTLPE